MNGQPPEQPEPQLRPTSVAMLAVAAVVAGVGGWVLFGKFYSDLPRLSVIPALTLLVLSVVESIAAGSTRARINRRPGTEPINPLAVARYVLVAKASAAAGALFTGAYGGVLLWVWTRRGELAAAGADVLPAALGWVFSVLLTAAALWLEYSCRIPRRPDEDSPDR